MKYMIEEIGCNRITQCNLSYDCVLVQGMKHGQSQFHPSISLAFSGKWYVQCHSYDEKEAQPAERGEE